MLQLAHASAARRTMVCMAISIVQLGNPRRPGEGVRIGTVRRPPRGVPKSDFARLDYYDVWFPNLSPSAELVQEALHAADVRAWAAFARKFRREMSAPDRSRELDAQAAAADQLPNLEIAELRARCQSLDRRRRRAFQERIDLLGRDDFAEAGLAS
jgi:uncharacterized protein YeaO (DUF488 family)